MHPARSGLTLPQYQKSVSSASQMHPSHIKSLLLPCRYHPQQYCQNYCIEPKCHQTLCSQCIQQHLLHHRKVGLNDLYVKSFRSVRNDCSIKLGKIIQRLMGKISMLGQPRNPQELFEDSDRELQQYRSLMHSMIDQHFLTLSQSLKQRISQTFSITKQLSQIHQTLSLIISQLKQHDIIISQGIISQQVSINDSISKTLNMNQTPLIQMFDKESARYEQKFRMAGLDVRFGEGEFRKALNDVLRVGDRVGDRMDRMDRMANSKVALAKGKDSLMEEQMGSRLRSRSKSPINDRNQSRHKPVSHPQPINYPLLHYFQSGTSLLHLLDLKKSQLHFSTISLPKFLIPSFHASILSQKSGSIYLSGGNNQVLQTCQKSRLFSKFSLLKTQFSPYFSQTKPRSSHSLCQDIQNQCIYILGGLGQSSRQQQTFFETSLQRVNIKTGQVTILPSSYNGGTNISLMSYHYIIKACIQMIEVYDTVNQNWTIIKNIKGPKIQMVFSRSVGYAMLQTNSIIVYGGYDQEERGRNDCFLVNFSFGLANMQDTTVDIQKVGWDLIIEEGFSTNPGIVWNGAVYALQNVEDQNIEAEYQERNLVKFDLQQKNWTMPKVNKPKRN